MSDPFDLDRFLVAQSGCYPAALAELRAGVKRGHWMWFVFPQIAGLGSSAMARRFAICALAEARAYLTHPELGARYRDCLAALSEEDDPDAARVFGAVDAMKLRSSLTLFGAAGSAAAQTELERWFGTPDPATLTLLGPDRQP